MSQLRKRKFPKHRDQSAGNMSNIRRRGFDGGLEGGWWGDVVGDVVWGGDVAGAMWWGDVVGRWLGWVGGGALVLRQAKKRQSINAAPRSHSNTHAHTRRDLVIMLLFSERLTLEYGFG